MKKLLLVSLLSFCSFSLANPEILEQKHEGVFAEDPWDFLENQFITIPKSKAARIDKVALKLSIISIPTFFTVILSQIASSAFIHFMARETLNIAEKPQNEIERAVFRLSHGIGAAVSLLPTSIAFKFFYTKAHNYLLSKIEEDNLKKFIENWPDNKKITPKQFHRDFEKLYSERKTLNTKTVNLLLKKSITRHFGTSPK